MSLQQGFETNLNPAYFDARGNVQLWCIHYQSISDADLLSKYLELLSPNERARIERFHFAKHRHQYLVTRAAIRSILSYYDPHVAPREWLFEKNQYGKPTILNTISGKTLHFNISHTDGLITIAISHQTEVGVDVEHLARKNNSLELARHYFSRTEYEALCSLNWDQQKLRFYELWTLKEAYIKACGMGLSLPLDCFAYSFSDAGEISIEFNSARDDCAELWTFWQIKPTKTHVIAVATKRDFEFACSPQKIQVRDFIPMVHISNDVYSVPSNKLVFS